MQSHYQHLEEHLACVTDCLQRQLDGNGNSVDVAVLVSQAWTYQKQVIDLEGVYQSAMRDRNYREEQLSTLRESWIDEERQNREAKKQAKNDAETDGRLQMRIEAIARRSLRVGYQHML